MTKTPTHLRKISDDRIFAYTEALAERPDMVPVWEAGEAPPESETSMSKGLELNIDNADENIKELLRDQNSMILRQEKQISLLGDENQRLHEEISRLEEALNESDETPSDAKTGDTEESQGVSVDDDTRMALLVEKTLEMIKNKDQNDFTGAGVPRVERLEAIAGIPEVTAQERTTAFEKAKEEMAKLI